MWVRSDVTSGRNRRWEWRPGAGDAEDGKTRSDASGRGARPSDAGLIFADVIDCILLHIARPDFEQSYEPSRQKTPERTIHILPTSQYPNAIVPTGLVTEESSHRPSGPVYVVNT